MNTSRRVQRVARNVVLTAAAAVGPASAQVALAAALPGGVYVERVGGTSAFGVGAGTANATSALPVFVDGFSTSGSPTSPLLTIAFPTAADPANGIRALTDVGQPGGTTPAAMNVMQLSPDGKWLTLAGFDDPTTGNVRTSGGVKTVGVINTTTGAVSTQLGFSSSAQPRSVNTVDGTNFWFIGSANGIRYVTPDATPNNLANTTLISASNVNQRSAAVFGGQLFVDGASSVATNTGAQPGVAFLGTGTPTTATQTQTYVMSTAANPEQFVMLDLNANSYVNGTVDTKLDTTYVGTDNGVEKWAFNGTAWTKLYTLGGGLSADTSSKLFGGIRGVTYAGKDGSGNPILYATTAGNSTVTTSAQGNALLRLVDTGSGADSWSTVLMSPDNSWFRGLQYVASARLAGDVNGDGFVNSGDINAFIYALSNDATAFAAQYPSGVYMNADVNGTNHDGDGFVNAADINPFIAILSGTGEPGIEAALAAVPEPTSLGLVGLGALGVIARRRGR